MTLLHDKFITFNPLKIVDKSRSLTENYMLWEKFQWILPLYMKPINFQSNASIVCLVATAIFIDFCLKKLGVFSQHTVKKQMNIWIPQRKSQRIGMLI